MSELLDVRLLGGTRVSDAATGQGYFPVITYLGGEELFLVYRGGAGHLGLDGRLDSALSIDGGLTWSPPEKIVDSDWDDRNPAAGVAPDGTVVLAYHRNGSYTENGVYKPDLAKIDNRMIYSRDRGKTWSCDTPIKFKLMNTPTDDLQMLSIHNGGSAFGKIFVDDGVLHMLAYGGYLPNINIPNNQTICIGKSSTPTCILRSRDNGKTWGDPTLVALGLNESDVAILPDGRWVFVARSEDEDEQAIHACISEDHGYNWHLIGRITEPREHPPDITLLSNGWLLLLFGHRHPPYGVQGRISKDGVITWDEQRLLLDDSLPGGDIGYPSTTLLENGRLVTAYYTAGTNNRQWDLYHATDASCKVVSYNETELINHWSLFP